MKGKRKIYVSPQIAKEAIKSKVSLEALAITLGIKITFVNSIAKDASVKRMMHVLRIGHARYKLALSYAIRQGWIVPQGDSLRATKIKALNAHNVLLTFKIDRSETKRTDDVRCPFSITRLCDYIRQAILLHHITKQAVVYDTINMATDPKHATEAARIRRAKKRVQRWGMRKPSLKIDADKLSYARIAQITGCSLTKSKSLVKDLIERGVISKHDNFQATRWTKEDYSHGLVESYAQYGDFGYLVLRDGKVFARLSNSYSINRCVVKFLAADVDKKHIA